MMGNVRFSCRCVQLSFACCCAYIYERVRMCAYVNTLAGVHTVVVNYRYVVLWRGGLKVYLSVCVHAGVCGWICNCCVLISNLILFLFSPTTVELTS